MTNISEREKKFFEKAQQLFTADKIQYSYISC